MELSLLTVVPFVFSCCIEIVLVGVFVIVVCEHGEITARQKQSPYPFYAKRLRLFMKILIWDAILIFGWSLFILISNDLSYNPLTTPLVIIDNECLIGGALWLISFLRPGNNTQKQNPLS